MIARSLPPVRSVVWRSMSTVPTSVKASGPDAGTQGGTRLPSDAASPIVVPTVGPQPSDLLLIGERPGRTEVRQGEPFVGPSGVEHWRRCTRVGLPPRVGWRIANLVPTYAPDPPTSIEIRRWTPALEDEIVRTDPRLIVAAGLYATRWFLGAEATMEACHGIPYQASGRIVVPVYHPAAALHQPDLASFCEWDLEQVALAVEGRIRVRDLGPRPWSRRDRPRWPRTVAVDTEGAVEAPECVSVAPTPDEAFLVRPPLPDPVRARLKTRRLILHHAKHDLRVLETLGVRPSRFEDTMTAAYLLSVEPQALKALAYRHAGMRMRDYDDLIRPLDDAVVRQRMASAIEEGLPRRADQAVRRLLETRADDSLRARWGRSVFAPCLDLPPMPTWADVPPQTAEPYALEDAVATSRIWPILDAGLRARGLRRVYRIDRDVLPLVARMETIGMQVNRTALVTLGRTLDQEYQQTVRHLGRLAGISLNPLSGRQVSAWLFDVLNLPATKLTRSGAHYTTEDKYLQALRDQHPGVNLICNARELWKLKSVYCDGIVQALPADDILHPTINTTRVVSGRFSAKDPNVLAIPKHSERWGKTVRAAFVARDGCRLSSWDLDQIEMRVMAHESRDPSLLKVFREGGDLHADTAHHLLGAPARAEDQDPSRHRLPAKAINFGILMGLTEIGLEAQLAQHGIRWPGDDYARFLAEWFRLHPGVKAYIDAKKAQARRTGYVTDWCGRRRYLAQIWSTDRMVRAEAERQAHATPIQAGAVEVMKIWMKAVWDHVLQDGRYRYAEPWLQVHDDLILEVGEEDREQVDWVVRTFLPQPFRVPITLKHSYGHTWGDL